MIIGRLLRDLQSIVSALLHTLPHASESPNVMLVLATYDFWYFYPYDHYFGTYYLLLVIVE